MPSFILAIWIVIFLCIFWFWFDLRNDDKKIIHALKKGARYVFLLPK